MQEVSNVISFDCKEWREIIVSVSSGNESALTLCTKP